MRINVRSLVVLVAILGVAVFAAACGTSDEVTTTTAAPETTLAPETTTAAATDITAAATEATVVGASAAASGSIVVKGMVDNPMTLTVQSLKAMTVADITAEHPKLGETQYSGVRFSDLLTAVKIQAAATTLILGCSDGFMAEVALADVKASVDSMIAIGDDGTLNAVMPGMGGKAWAKDIISMEFE